MRVYTIDEIPKEVVSLENGCGFIAIWAILNSFGDNFDYDEIYKKVDFNPEIGMHTVAIANLLDSFGYRVIFNTKIDISPTDVEIKHYDLLNKTKVQVVDNLTLENLQEYKDKDWIILLLMDTPEGDGHFSIFDGIDDKYIYLHNYKTFERKMFESLWDTNDILKQCLLIQKILN